MCALSAQNTASLKGTVTDPSGSVVPGALVQCRDLAREWRATEGRRASDQPVPTDQFRGGEPADHRQLVRYFLRRHSREIPSIHHARRRGGFLAIGSGGRCGRVSAGLGLIPRIRGGDLLLPWHPGQRDGDKAALAVAIGDVAAVLRGADDRGAAGNAHVSHRQPP